MRERRADRERHRAQEFEDFAAGAAGRLLRTAELLAGDRATPLLTMALARTYAEWDGLRGEDPYDRARQILAVRFAYGAWHRHRPYGGPLERLSPQERLVLVLWLHEGLAPEQTAAVLGMAEERVRALCARAVDTMRAGVRSAAAGGGAYGVDGGDRPDLPDRRTREVARTLKGPYPQVPADLALRAGERGARLLRRRRALNRLFVCVLWAVVIVFTVWAATSHPWVAPPADTTPPLEGW